MRTTRQRHNHMHSWCYSGHLWQDRVSESVYRAVDEKWPSLSLTLLTLSPSLCLSLCLSLSPTMSVPLCTTHTAPLKPSR